MKMLLKVLCLSVLLPLLQARSACGAEPATGASHCVGNPGDPARVSIEGVHTFNERDIRRALRTDLDYLVASHPEATMAGCLAGLEDRVRAGYRACGFRDVVVQARFDLSAGRIIARVTEGPRFLCGALHVTGLKSIPVADFTRRFAEELAPASDQTTPPAGIWKAGAPVNFTPHSLINHSAAASNTFAALGRFMPTFKVEIQAQPRGKNAVLAVIVADEGPAAILRDIKVVGNHKNRRDAVISLLGLSNGIKITKDLIDEKARVLTQAARFTNSSITPTVLGPDGQVGLRIAVAENGRLPPLQQALSREEKTLLRLRDWLMAWESRGEDLIVSWSLPTAQGKGPQRIEAIVAPSGGIMARVMGNSPGQEKLHDLYSMIVKTDALALFAQLHQRKLRIPLPPGYAGIFFVKLGPCTTCPSGFSFTLGAGLSPAKTNTSWHVCLDLLPAAFTDFLCRPGTSATWQGDLLTVRTKDWAVRVDEGTGRLLELSPVGGESAAGAGTSDSSRLAIRFETGAFARSVDRIGASTSTHADAFQSQRALGSALGFVAAELARAESLWSSAPGGRLPQQRAALASALEKLLASSFLDPLQTLLHKEEVPPSDQVFTIPGRQVEKQDPVQQVIEEVRLWCAGNAQELAPAGSWLQILLREVGFRLPSTREHTAAALARLAEADDLGPIGCYAVLHALQGGHRDSEGTFPDLGSRELATEHFRRDYRMLFDPGSVITRCLGNLARELGSLTQPEVEAVAGLLPPDGAALVREIASAARNSKDLPVSDAIGPALDRWWETVAKERVAADFRFHAQRSSRP